METSSKSERRQCVPFEFTIGARRSFLDLIDRWFPGVVCRGGRKLSLSPPPPPHLFLHSFLYFFGPLVNCCLVSWKFSIDSFSSKSREIRNEIFSPKKKEIEKVISPFYFFSKTTKSRLLGIQRSRGSNFQIVAPITHNSCIFVFLCFSRFAI